MVRYLVECLGYSAFVLEFYIAFGIILICLTGDCFINKLKFRDPIKSYEIVPSILLQWILDLIECIRHNDSFYITKQYFVANGDRLNSQITKSLLGMHFTNTFHDQNLYIFAIKILLTRSFDMSNFAVSTKR